MKKGEVKGVATEIVKSVLSYQLGRNIIPEIPPYKTLVEIHNRVSTILAAHLDDEMELEDILYGITNKGNQNMNGALDEVKSALDQDIP